jgi:hypothetical protein
MSQPIVSISLGLGKLLLPLLPVDLLLFHDSGRSHPCKEPALVVHRRVSLTQIACHAQDSPRSWRTMYYVTRCRETAVCGMRTLVTALGTSSTDLTPPPKPNCPGSGLMPTSAHIALLLLFCAQACWR